MKLLHEELTEKILKAFYKVYNVLGYGFLEKVYENAMCVELKNMGMLASRQQPIKVLYNNEQVGEYFSDILVDQLVIIELKACTTILEEHECQLINYLKATDKEVGLILNFGKSPQFKRKVFENKNKKHRVEH